MNMLRATAALLLMTSAAAAAPAIAQSAGFAPAPSMPAPATAVPSHPRGGGDGPSLSGRPWQDDDRPGHPCEKRGRCRDRNFFFGYGYGYGHGYERDFGYRDMTEEARNGYFNHGGEASGMRNGRVSYDYDRGYPYEYYRDRKDPNDNERPREYTARGRQCETELTRDRRGQQISVRVCRN